MIDQEQASIIYFILTKAEGTSPSYTTLPRRFKIPAVYFPTPEIESGPDTLATYRLDYTWYVKFFHINGEAANALAQAVLNFIRLERNLIPLLDEDGAQIENEWIRINDPKLELLDDGTAQLIISWRSIRPYENYVNEPEKLKGPFKCDFLPPPAKEVYDPLVDLTDENEKDEKGAEDV